MKTIKYKARVFSGLLGLSLVFITLRGYSAPITPTDWKRECVGQYLVDLPGEVEVALTNLSAFLMPNDTTNTWIFNDNSVAPYSHSSFVSREISKSEYQELKRQVFINMVNGKKELLRESKNVASNAIRPILFGKDGWFGWRGDKYAKVYFYQKHRLYYFSEDSEMLDKQITNLQSSFYTRMLYEIPKEQGICIPYGFIAGNEKDVHGVAVTMRLKDHPDVVIFFQDSSGQVFYNRTLDEQIIFIWEYYYRYYLDNLDAPPRQVKFGFPKTQSVKLAGQKGLSSFGEISNPDGTLDYGYVAVAEADPDAKVDTPNLMFTVMRTGVRAKGTPVSDKELKAMAEKIAASIKHR